MIPSIDFCRSRPNKSNDRSQVLKRSSISLYKRLARCDVNVNGQIVQPVYSAKVRPPARAKLFRRHALCTSLRPPRSAFSTDVKYFCHAACLNFNFFMAILINSRGVPYAAVPKQSSIPNCARPMSSTPAAPALRRRYAAQPATRTRLTPPPGTTPRYAHSDNSYER